MQLSGQFVPSNFLRFNWGFALAKPDIRPLAAKLLLLPLFLLPVATCHSCRLCIEGKAVCSQAVKSVMDELMQANVHLTCQPNDPLSTC